MSGDFTIADIGLADSGRLKVEWARSRMPALASLREKAELERPLDGQRIAGCLHVTKETAVLIETLQACGRRDILVRCNPSQHRTMLQHGLPPRDIRSTWHGGNQGFYDCIDRTLDLKPTLTLDDGADLIYCVHSKFKDLAEGIIGGTEETTTEFTDSGQWRMPESFVSGNRS